MGFTHPIFGGTPLDWASRETIERMFEEHLRSQAQVDKAWVYVVAEWKRTSGRFYAYNVACCAIASVTPVSER